jgi:anti-sigma factor RsiW
MPSARSAVQRRSTPASQPTWLTHAVVHNHLSDFLAGDLAPAPTAAIEAHLTTCGACRTDAVTLQSTIELLKTLPSLVAPSSLKKRILALTSQS